MVTADLSKPCGPSTIQVVVQPQFEHTASTVYVNTRSNTERKRPKFRGRGVWEGSCVAVGRALPVSCLSSSLVQPKQPSTQTLYNSRKKKHRKKKHHKKHNKVFPDVEVGCPCHHRCISHFKFTEQNKTLQFVCYVIFLHHNPLINLTITASCFLP